MIVGAIAARSAAIVPIVPDPYWASVKLLASFEGADESTTFVDLASSAGTLTGGGGAKIDTATYINGALLLNGTSSGSRVSSSKASAVGTGAFTWEAFIRPSSAVVGRVISANLASTPAAMLVLRVDADGALRYMIRNSASGGYVTEFSSAGLIDQDGSTEYHVCLERDSSGFISLYINGARVVGPTYCVTNPDNSRAFFIGALDNTQERFAGNIRWVRVTEGVARYGGAPFSVPSIPYPLS
jgi:hypothetical protein